MRIAGWDEAVDKLDKSDEYKIYSTKLPQTRLRLITSWENCSEPATKNTTHLSC